MTTNRLPTRHSNPNPRFGQADKGTGDFKHTYEKFYNAHRAHRKYELITEWRCNWATHIFYFGFIGENHDAYRRAKSSPYTQAQGR